MKRIFGQTVAVTALDADGDRITPEHLRLLFDQLPDEWLMSRDHDLSLPPIAKASNKRLVSRDDGELAIEVDVNILDEAAFEVCGGFSISYAFKRMQVGAKARGDIDVRFDPRLFDEGDIVKAIGLTDDDTQIDAVAMKQKAGVLEVAILGVVFVSSLVAAGFFGKMGDDAYQKLKQWIKDLGQSRRERQKGKATLHMILPMELEFGEVQVVVLLDFDNVDLVSRPEASTAHLKDFLGNVVEEKNARRIVVRPIVTPPFWLLVRVICGEGLMGL